MAEPITITVEDVKNAVSTVDIATKEALTRAMAQMCVEPVEIVSTEDESLPPMFRENRKLRSQFQMGILATMLGKKYEVQKAKIRGKDGEKDIPWCMGETDYNQWDASHVMNQLERLKKTADKTVANAVFDILYDYRSVEMMLAGAIRDELEAHNDPFNRAMMYLSKEAVRAAMNSTVDGELKRLIESEEKRNVR